jgi:uncharacterized membrane protein YdbT with pleckstrin-like domain
MCCETLVWKKKPSQVVNLGIFAQLGLFIIIWLVLPHKVLTLVLVKPINVNHIVLLINLIYLSCTITAILFVMSIRYELTEERLLVYSGILTQKRDEIELYRVNDYKVISPFFMRLFFKGTIKIFSSDQTTPTITLVGMRDAFKVADSIRLHVESIKVKKNILFVKS